jgi:hypothetical protein
MTTLSPMGLRPVADFALEVIGSPLDITGLVSRLPLENYNPYSM